MHHNEPMGNIVNRALLISCLLLTLHGAQAAVYKTVDKDGNVSYSDSPSKSAEELDLPPVPVINISPSPQLNLTPKQEIKQGQWTYTQLAIKKPQSNATIRNNAGNISVELLIDPPLRESDTILLKSNGKEVSRGRSNTLAITQMNRGSHALQAIIINANGETLSSSETITFHLQRQSQLLNRAK